MVCLQRSSWCRMERGVVQQLHGGEARAMYQLREYSRPAARRRSVVQQGRYRRHLLVSLRTFLQLAFD